MGVRSSVWKRKCIRSCLLLLTTAQLYNDVSTGIEDLVSASMTVLSVPRNGAVRYGLQHNEQQEGVTALRLSH